MRVNVLGPTQVHRADGTPVPVGGARLRAVLTVLALRAGRTVPPGTLVDEVWAGDPPADAAGALQALIGRLRRALGPDAVVSVDGGYRLGPGPDAVDLHRFERLTAEGVRALGAGDTEAALTALDRALALWHGDPLADLPDRTAEAARWEARRTDAQRARAAALLPAGRAEEALPELSALCREHPYDEPLHALRLRALRDTGRRAEALAGYEEVRRRLADGLGTDPGPELRALHAELLTPPTEPAPAPVAAAAPVGPVRPVAPGVPVGPVRPEAAAPVRPGAGSAVGPEGGEGQTGAAAPVHPEGGPPEAGEVRPGAAAPVHPEAGEGQPGAAPSVHPEAGRSEAGEVRPGAAAPVHPEAGRPRAVGVQPQVAPPVHPEAEVAPPGAPAVRPETGPVRQEQHPAPASPAPAPVSPGPRPAPAVPGNLRARLTSFVGREADIATVLADLGRSRLVTLLGPGGSGKTRLSQEAAERGAGAWPDGVWLAELAPVDDPEAVPDAVVTAIGARGTVLHGAGAEELRAVERHGGGRAGAGAALARLVEHCADRRMLLLLDNCEHVVGAAAELAERLLAACPGLTVLATSREPLGVPGEQVRPVDPLPGPSALELLGHRGAAARPGFDPADAPEACAEICRRLDGLPLAIELAAARLRALTPAQIAARLDDRFRLLTGGSRTVLPRQQTLRAVVDWSWDLLDEAERTVLRRLSVFSGGCDLEAAEAVCATAGAMDLLGSLVDKSLVLAVPAADGQMRYRLLETVAEYGAERLDEAGDRAATERRHLVHYRELARTTDPELRGPRQRAALDRFQREYENLRGALRRAVAARDEQEALCLVHSLARYWQMRDLRADAQHFSGATAALGPDPYAEPVRPAPPLTASCTDAPPPMSEELLWEARRGNALMHMVFMDHYAANWIDPDGQARMSAIRAAYRPGLPQTCRMPGGLWIYALLGLGDAALLREVLDATVRTCRELGYAWELANALGVRAQLLANVAETAIDAARDAEESLEVFERVGDSWGTAEALSARGEARELLDDYEGAGRDYAAAVGHAELLGAQGQRSLLRVRYAQTLVQRGRRAEGEAILREVLAAGRAEAHEAVAPARVFLALLLGHTGRTAEARDQLAELNRESGTESMALFHGFVIGTLAWLDTLDGRYAEALALVRQAMDRAREPLALSLAPNMLAVHLITASRAATGLGGPHARTGAVLIGAADALRPPGYRGSPMERESRADAAAAARAALGAEAFEAAYAEGGGLTLEQAAALVPVPDPRPDTAPGPEPFAGLRSSSGTARPPAGPRSG
ncbi:AfsR/SARP family transcriptional regulator [Streptomyces lichenis]|uniref:Winged helix-turn-helix domain-containing protein n=1 Tax=Streptomyces lichenis TaxID=2306967 RepID=A0ABT0IA21_9ACTN|nr:BTAD domain-containing putative transcriptional regulator [Streptomyces lichenis]MCK8678178.1 winged helix-turn-helix domain-containing protein [Streptomyces lichenis]